MTTKLSKILTVFLTVASVAFMAVIIANVKAGGPNWVAKSKDLPEVAFEQANPQAPWTAKKRTDNSDMGGGPILPAAIVSVQKKLIDAERTAQTELDTKITTRKAAIAEAKAQIEADLDAMKRRLADLEKQYLEAQAQLNQISQEFTVEAKKQIDDLDVLKLRKEEFIRVKNQLEELRAQRGVATDELARLKALLYQAKANLERAGMRKKLLEEDGANVNYEEDVTPAKQAAPAAGAESDKTEKTE